MLSQDVKSFHSDQLESRISILKITALWAFSESAFGGILHALAIPLRGIFISSAAVLFISLLALFAKSNREILKATIIVVLIKAVVSPHSPITAYMAVSFQGLLGFLVFSTKKFYKLSALLLGILVLLFSGLQKILILTILFGSTLWKSIDIFIQHVSSEILRINQTDINYGYLLIGTYLALHLLAGLFIGIYSGRLPDRIIYHKKTIPFIIEYKTAEEIPRKEKRKKKKWFFRPTGVILILFSAGVIILSYTSPVLGNNFAFSVIIMLVRSIVIMITWYTLLVPVMKKLLQIFVVKKKSVYAKDLEVIISMFPQFRNILNYCWKYSKNKKRFSRIRYFLSTSFYYLLLSKNF